MIDTINRKTVSEEEVEKFSRIAGEWWDEEGKFKLLHQINPSRIRYIKEKIVSHFELKNSLNGISLLDIGCGGGLISEPMSRLGASVSAIDASEKNIQVASLHAKRSNLEINYAHTTVEEFSQGGKQFDVVLALEIVEHVDDLNLFIEKCLNLVKTDGIIILSTLNRTLKSFAFAIVGAEYLLRWLPTGTHNWKKFVKPSELVSLAHKLGSSLIELKGLNLDIYKQKWTIDDNIDVNYIGTFRKR
jgi:2-polyprenyl-6-hydroxyphenyl methylase / 3-demethylubiquinone-9 3-methyltransferase